MLGVIGYMLKQPLIVGYILGGVLIGSAGFNLITDTSVLQIIAKIGITFLLFLIGIELNLKQFREIGGIGFIVGLAQMVITFLLGFLITLGLGFALVPAAYIGLALAFSSTAIVVKLLQEKHDINSVHGQLVLAILLVQDAVAIIALMFLNTLRVDGGFSFSTTTILIFLLKALVLVAVAFGLSQTLIKNTFKTISKSYELTFITGVAWCFIFAIAAEEIGFSIEIGAFLAGVSLANIAYTFEIIPKVKILRDFFITIFFVSLGANLVININLLIFVQLIILSCFVIFFKPLLIAILTGFGGYQKRTSFMTGISLAQISTFSFVLLAAGVELGHIPYDVLSLVTLVGIVAFLVSSYFIVHNNHLYEHFRPYIGFLQTRKKLRDDMSHLGEGYKGHIVLLGCGQIGLDIVNLLTQLNKQVVVVDYDPKVINAMIQRNIPCMYGDIEDFEILAEINLEEACMVISTVPNYKDNYLVMKYLRKHQSKAVTLILAHDPDEAMELFEQGADFTILTPYVGGKYLHDVICILLGVGENIASSLSFKGSSHEIKIDYNQKDRVLATNAARLREFKRRKITL